MLSIHRTAAKTTPATLRHSAKSRRYQIFGSASYCERQWLEMAEFANLIDVETINALENIWEKWTKTRARTGQRLQRKVKIAQDRIICRSCFGQFLCSLHELNFHRMHLYSYLFSKCASLTQKKWTWSSWVRRFFCVHCIMASWQMAMLGADKIISLRQTINAIHFNAWHHTYRIQQKKIIPHA